MLAPTETRLLIAALLFSGTALAEPPRWPTADEQAQALAKHPFPSSAQTTAEPPRAVPIPRTNDTPPGTLNLEALARQGSALSSAAADVPGAPALQIFITLKMPQASLQRLVDQATRTGATLVLRGLKAQSLRQTLAAVKPLLETHRVAWVIDPEAFARYHVTVAPTFVLTRASAPAANAPAPCVNGAAPLGEAVSVAGDVSLDYALDVMVKRNPALAPEASALLARLRRS